MLNIKRLPFIIVFFAFFISKNTNAQKINQFDANKQRTGVWQKYYPNNKIRYSGTFKNGKEIGVFKFYDDSNSSFPSIIKTFTEGKSEVLVEFYKTTGDIQSKGYFIDKNRVGKWTFYFTNGKVLSEEFYKDGKLDGILINYYPNGKITEESFYKNGLKDGVSKTYTSDGVLIEEVNYKEGKLNGSARYFELNGNLKELGDYKDGKRVGEWEYYLDGEITTEKELKKNKSSYSKSNEN
ncbi:toxin-antitoxin system YwqK family antitoxin [Polaribacter sp. Asnod1-A03]|uniref:toxin-antitoxin system YwqK family antitoxin n=1 Tax=Polaribacter sp. Asnod1-A03 TaxID=3160581 RepID=UPI0038705F42